MLGFAQISSTALDYSKMSANELNEALIVAVKNGSYDEVQKLVRAGANGDQNITYTKSHYDDYDSKITCSLIKYASRNGYVDIVKELIKAKPKIDDINEALIFAAQEGHANVVRELIQADDNVNGGGGLLGFFKSFFNVSRPNKSHLDIALIRAAEAFPGITTHLATGKPNYSDLKNHLDVIKLLIQAGAQVNHTNEFGNTALIKVIQCSLYTEEQKKARAEIIQVILKAGANVNHANKEGDTALIRAIKEHDLDAVQILLKTPGININYADNNGNTALIIALQYIKTTYIPGNNKEYNNCLNSQKILETLLQIPGINPHHVNKKGDTAIKLLEKVTGKMNY